MTVFSRLRLSLIAGLTSALVITGICSPKTNSLFFFSRLFFGTTIDREYVPADENKDEVTFGCWIIEFFSGLFG